MDLIYGKRTDEEGEPANKRLRPDVLDLPIHLPNVKPVAKPLVENKEEKPKEHRQGDAVTVIGSDVRLDSQTDIDEWIKERKANWMKRISNSKKGQEEEERETKGSVVSDSSMEIPTQRKPQSQQQGARQQGQQRGQAQNRKSGPGGHNHRRHEQFNLNKVIMQRGLTEENTRILDVIKQLFERGIVGKEG